MIPKEQLLAAFNFRFACKEFDPARKIPRENFTAILEAGRLSPSSFGFEPWEFIVVQNMATREKIRAVSWGAQKQLPTASHFIVLLARKAADLRTDADYLKSIMSEVQKDPADVVERRLVRVKSFQENDFHLDNDRAFFDWACKQTYIALGNMMTAAAFIGIDSCPIEGFNREKLETILSKEKILDSRHFGVACMVAFGYRLDEPTEEKTRRPTGDVIRWIS